MSTHMREYSPNLSLREKTLHKRRVTKEHNSNFHAGYVHVNEEYLHKTGIRGRKRYIIYVILLLMAVTAIVNIFITWVIMGSLRISKDGMATIEFIPGSQLVRFLAESDLGEVFLAEDSIISLASKEMEISGMGDNTVNLKASKQNTTLHVDAQGVTFSNTAEFSVKDTDTGQHIFTTNFEQLRFPDETKSIKTTEINANRVISPKGEDLRLESERETYLRGAEGVTAETKEYSISAKENIDLTTDQQLILNGRDGLFIDAVRWLTTATDQDTDVDPPEASYRLCVCLPSGRVFAVPAPFHCDQANEDQNPCKD